MRNLRVLRDFSKIPWSECGRAGIEYQIKTKSSLFLSLHTGPQRVSQRRDGTWRERQRAQENEVA